MKDDKEQGTESIDTPIPTQASEQAAEAVDSSSQEDTEKAEAEKVEPEKAEPEKVETEKAETEKVETEKVETEKVEAEKVEPEKAEAEKAEAEKIEPVKAEPDKEGKTSKMKFIVSSTTLLKGLELIGGVISSNTVLPILEDFLFDIKDSKLTIYSSDLETSMSTTVEVEAKANGKIAIPATILLETLKALPEQPITFSVDPKNFGIELTSNNGKYKLSGENGDDFPKIPVAEKASNFSISSTILSKALTYTLFAASNDELRPAMTGIYVQLESDGLTFVATDSHKLIRYRHLGTKADTGSSFILPKKAANLLKTALLNEDTNIKIEFDSSNAFFSFNNTHLICRLIDARYPDYNTVIPKENPNLLTISREEIENSLKRISIYANKTTYQVILKISGSELNISSQDLDFSNEANERLTCQYQGDDIEIAFNGKFMTEMLGVLESDEIRLELSTPTRAGIILPASSEEQEDILMLIMPIMMNT